ncbi:hypothetical protein GCM10029976_024840 [Kribbella albertanoniae]|uniref:hypothetical protein n=1 Tax=Kribbella albertanoniae TaxID=1266829 RepID=UPI0014050E41|nr:hypothetical protein [Kribbella albertanoniae]
MAALLQLSVPSATRDQFDELDDRVGQAMATAGGPPPGLMAHVVHPEGDGFTITQVWRTEAEGLAYVDNVLHALLADLHLTPTETTIHPVWSFARP